MRIFSTSRNLIELIKDAFRKMNLQIGRLYVSKPRIFELAMAVAVFLFILVYALQRAGQPFVHDFLNYWNLADSFLQDGKFSFTNFSSGLRGYFFPFVLFLIKSLASALGIDAELFFYICSAFYFTLFSVYLLPWAFQTIFDWEISFWGRATIAVLIFFFWRGYFLYPLTDFPAFTALLMGLALFAQSGRHRSPPLRAFFIGVFISAAANIRPAYQLSFILLIPFFFIYGYKLKFFQAMQWIVFLLLGSSLVLLPQVRINQAHFQINSPWVLARYVDDENLFVKQLFWGLGAQKYETNIGENYASAAVVYQDPLAKKVSGNLLKNKTISGYFEILKRHPQDVAVSYFRHFFNGIDIFFPTPYIKNPYSNHTLFSAVNYLIWFLVAYSLMWTDYAHVDRVQWAGMLAVLAPVFLAIPTTVEVRFFLPVYILAYGIIAFGIDYPALETSIFGDKWKLLRLALALALWLMVCFALSAATIENLLPAP